VAVETEAVEGTAETLVAADVFIAYDITIEPGIEMQERGGTRDTLSALKSVRGERSCTVSFATELKGSGTAGTAPAWGESLIACGASETVVPVTSVTYAPSMVSIPSVTIGIKNADEASSGVVFRTWGCRGNMSLEINKGEFGRIVFSFTGADWEVVDEALFGAVSYSTVEPVAALSMSFTVDSYAAAVSALTMDQGNTLTLLNDFNKPSGNLAAKIANRRAVGTIDPYMELVATYDWFGKWKSGNEGALTAALTGASGNITTITAPKVQYNNLGREDKEGLLGLSVDMLLNGNTGDDEWSIALT
jgi:hypothetical protein